MHLAPVDGRNSYVTNTADFPRDEFDAQRPKPEGWLSAEEIAGMRARLPIIYVDAIPVRTDDSGDVIAVGLLLRVTESGHMTRALVSGRVLYHERVRDALLRHIEKDLGPVALPRITAYHDERQHAISLAYVVPVRGDCLPQQNALDLAWLTPEEACSDQIMAELEGGQDLLLRQALAHVGRLP